MFVDVEYNDCVGAQLETLAQVHRRKMHATHNATQCVPVETVCTLMCGEQTATLVLDVTEYIDSALTFTQCSILIDEGKVRVVVVEP